MDAPQQSLNLSVINNAYKKLSLESIFGGFQHALGIAAKGYAVLVAMAEPEPAAAPETFADVELHHVVNVLASHL